MGDSKDFNENGRLNNPQFKQVGITANGIKILVKKSNNRSSTPAYSNTPDTMYTKIDNSSGIVNQVAVYGNGNEHRAKIKDIDVGHSHKNHGGKLKFTKKDIHIHEYDKNAVRSKIARKPSKKERRLLMIARYGDRKL